MSLCITNLCITKKPRTFAACFLLLVIPFAGCAAPQAETPARISTAGDCASQHDIYVINHGWHTGIALAARDANTVMPALAQRFNHGAFYEIGWGDIDFYQADEVTAGLALHALFASSGSVVHVVSIDDPPPLRFPGSEVRRISVEPSGFENLLNYIQSSFQRDTEGNIVALGKGLYGDSEFYAGVGNFHAFNTCNTWTAKALQSAGIDIDPSLKLTAGSVIDAVDKLQASAKPTCTQR